MAYIYDRLFLQEEYLRIPEDVIKPHCESVNMMRKVGFGDGIMDFLSTDYEVTILFINALALDWHHW